MPFPLALVFGALVAATDPVAVVALFRSLGVPKRLQVLLEGESLFNDGTAIVIFHLMLVVAISGQFSLTESLLDFFVVAGGGLLVGLMLGILISQAISHIDDPLIETALTTVLAFGAYLVAEELHVSGVLAVVAAGLVSGNIGPRGMSASTRMLVYNFWDYAAFLANSFVFLLIGMQIDLEILVANWHVIGWAIIAVLLARAVGVYGLSWIGPGVPRRFKHVLYWGGLRGAISLALALSLPTALGTARNEIQTMTFGVVLFTLLVQGLSMKPLVQHMQLIQRGKSQDEYERRHGRSVMARASYERLENMYHEGLLSTHVWGILSKPLERHAQVMAAAVTETLHTSPDLEANVLDAAIQELLQTQRNSLTAMMRDNIISEKIFSRLLGEVDTALAGPRTNMIELLRRSTRSPVNELLVVVVQKRDIENTISVLNRLGLPVTRLSSTGVFLGRKNVTLLIGIPTGYEHLVIRALNESSQQRIELLPTSDKYEQSPKVSSREIPNGQTEISTPTSVTVKGAIIFTFDVERYEEL